MRVRLPRRCAKPRKRPGLRPSLIEPIGYLDLYLTFSGFRILPTVARVKPEFTLTLNPGEVTETFEVPLEFLMTPANHQRKTRDWNGLERDYYAIPFENRYIWGITAGILRNLYERVMDRMIRPVLTEIGLFLTPFVLYAAFLFATRAGVLHPPAWTLRRLVGLAHRIAVAGDRQLHRAGEIFRLAAGLDLCAGACRRRQIRAGSDAVTAERKSRQRRLVQARRGLASLLALLDRDGEEARVVGGAVRNALLHIEVVEIDIATTAVPEEVVRRAERAGWKAVPTGIEHGTVTVVIDGKPFEVTTLRQDVETYGRKAKVVFGRDWKADAERRDFTINALSARADGTVYDYVGGIADIDARRVRFIGDPQQRIAEDYLRILRFFRFHAWYGEGAPDAAGLHACIVARGGPRNAVARAGAHGVAEAPAGAARRRRRSR